MSLLFSRDDPRHLHFLGIGGAGVSALALAALRRGIPVIGGDSSTDAFADLQGAGATVYQGSRPELLSGARALIHTAAAPPDHPMLLAAHAHGIPTVPRKVALAALVNGKQVIALAGTHGKTTTTVMTTLALQGAGLAPSALAGGRVGAWGGNACLDGEDLWVVEADEYDQAFLTLTPTVAVINNVEADHLECYGSVDEMESAFVRFAAAATTVLVGNADPGSDRVARRLGSPIRFGFEAPEGLSISSARQSPAGSEAILRWPDGLELPLRLGVPGAHNLRNAAGALGAVRAVGGELRGAATALAGFTGVGRRFERGPEVGGVAFVDDYAHHPTELAATLAAARQAYPERRLVAVFQPHLYSRTREHHRAMGEALTASDVAVVTDVYPAREMPLPGITGELVVQAARAVGAPAIYQPDRAQLDRTIAELVRPGDLVLTLGAGDVTKVGPAVRSLLGTD